MVHCIEKKFAGILVIACLFSFPVFGQSKGLFIDNESNVRDGPSTNGKIVFQSKAGRSFDILETSGKWFKIRLDDGTSGWTSKINIKILEDAKKPAKEGKPKEIAKIPNTPITPEPTAEPSVSDSSEIKRWQEAALKNSADPVAKFMLGVAYLDGNDKKLANGEVEKLQTLNKELAKDLKKIIDDK